MVGVVIRNTAPADLSLYGSQNVLLVLSCSSCNINGAVQLSKVTHDSIEKSKINKIYREYI